MTKKNKLTKIIIIFILAFFVAVTWLSMIVPYIGGNTTTQGTWDILTGDTGSATWTVASWIDLSWSTK